MIVLLEVGGVRSPLCGEREVRPNLDMVFRGEVECVAFEACCVVVISEGLDLASNTLQQLTSVGGEESGLWRP